MTYYTVYRTQNIVNGHYYFGAHKTKNPYDKYLGSGLLLNRAIRKYGRNSFLKNVCFIFNTAEEAFEKEQELIATYREDPACYNIHEGGQGGFDYINQKVPLEVRQQRQSIIGKQNKGKKYRPMSEEARSNISEAQQRRFQRDGYRTGWHHTEESRRLQSTKAKGRVMSEQTRDLLRTKVIGRKWYNNGQISKRFSPNALVPNGFILGRLMTSPSPK